MRQILCDREVKFECHGVVQARASSGPGFVDTVLVYYSMHSRLGLVLINLGNLCLGLLPRFLVLLCPFNLALGIGELEDALLAHTLEAGMGVGFGLTM